MVRMYIIYTLIGIFSKLDISHAIHQREFVGTVPLSGPRSNAGDSNNSEFILARLLRNRYTLSLPLTSTMPNCLENPLLGDASVRHQKTQWRRYTWASAAPAARQGPVCSLSNYGDSPQQPLWLPLVLRYTPTDDLHRPGCLGMSLVHIVSLFRRSIGVMIKIRHCNEK